MDYAFLTSIDQDRISSGVTNQRPMTISLRDECSALVTFFSHEIQRASWVRRATSKAISFGNSRNYIGALGDHSGGFCRRIFDS